MDDDSSLCATDCLEDRLFFPPVSDLAWYSCIWRERKRGSKGVKRSCEYGATYAVRAPLFPANRDIGPNDRSSFTISLHTTDQDTAFPIFLEPQKV